MLEQIETGKKNIRLTMSPEQLVEAEIRAASMGERQESFPISMPYRALSLPRCNFISLKTPHFS